METIPKNDCIQVGYLQKPHGINGEVILRFQEKFYESLEKIDNILLIEIEGLLVPYFLEEEIRFRTGDSAIVKLQWIDDEKKAKEIAGMQVYLKQEQVIADHVLEIEGLKGYLLIDQRKQQLGEITNVDNFSGNIILTVNYLNSEVMVPFNDDFLISIDEGKKIIALDIPDGILDLDEE